MSGLGTMATELQLLSGAQSQRDALNRRGRLRDCQVDVKPRGAWGAHTQHSIWGFKQMNVVLRRKLQLFMLKFNLTYCP